MGRGEEKSSSSRDSNMSELERATRGGTAFQDAFGDLSIHSTHSIRSDPVSDATSGSTNPAGVVLRKHEHKTKRIQVGIAQIPSHKDQDRYAVELTDDPSSPHFICTLDGHGTSALAADIAMDRLLPEILAAEERLGHKASAEGPSIPSDEAITEGFRAVEAEVFRYVETHPRTGTCVVALMIGLEGNMDEERAEDEKDAVVKCAWVGDSRCVMVDDASGEVRELSRDHRVNDNEEELERILESDMGPREEIINSIAWEQELENCKKAGIRPRASSFVARRMVNGVDAGPRCVFAHTGGVSLQISRSIGDRYGARSVICDPEITTIHARSNESARFILASDGLFDVFSSQQAAKYIENTSDPLKAASKLASAAKSKRLYSGRSSDDITVIIVDVNRSEVPKKGGRIRRGSNKCSIM